MPLVPESHERSLANALLSHGLIDARELTDSAPRQIGRYQVERLLGKGASGEVFAARDPEIGRVVAIKLLRGEVGETLVRFRQEMRVLANLEHPGIVDIHDAGTHDERAYFVMEYLGDRSLADGDFTSDETVEILEQVARACHAAHQAGVIHHDLKPANILLSDRPVVADFGVAKVMDEPGATRTGSIIGTPHYMSPEQLQGRRGDPRTDVYALGVILYEKLTGRLPFSGDNVLEVITKVATIRPERPGGLVPTLPRHLEQIVLRAMAPEADQRFQSAGDLAEALRNFREKGAPPADLRRFAELDRGSRRWPMAAAALCIFCIFIGLRKPVGRWLRGPVAETAGQTQVPPGEAVDPGTQLTHYERQLQRWLDAPPPDSRSWEPVDPAWTRPPWNPETLDALETSLGPLTSASTPDIADRQRAFLLRARARRLAGDSAGALRDLGRAIGTAAPTWLGLCHRERAHILLTRLIPRWLQNQTDAIPLRDNVIAEIEAAVEHLPVTAPELPAERLLVAVLNSLDSGSPFTDDLSSLSSLHRGYALLLGDHENGDDEVRRHLVMARGQSASTIAARVALAINLVLPAAKKDNITALAEAIAITLRAIDLQPGSATACEALNSIVIYSMTTDKPLPLIQLVDISPYLSRLRAGYKQRIGSAPVATALATACTLAAFKRLLTSKHDPRHLLEEAEEALGQALILETEDAAPALISALYQAVRGQHLLRSGGSARDAHDAAIKALQRAGTQKFGSQNRRLERLINTMTSKAVSPSAR